MTSSLFLSLLGGAILGAGLFFAVTAYVGMPERDLSRPSVLRRPTLTGSVTRLVRGMVVSPVWLWSLPRCATPADRAVALVRAHRGVVRWLIWAGVNLGRDRAD